jgi:hypothetical protein
MQKVIAPHKAWQLNKQTKLTQEPLLPSIKYSHNRSLPVLGKPNFPVISQMPEILACHVLPSRKMGQKFSTSLIC